jgi:hypothetical protein
VCQHQECVQDLEPDGWYYEEVHRHHAPHMIVEERAPTCEGGFRNRTMYLATVAR